MDRTLKLINQLEKFLKEAKSVQSQNTELDYNLENFLFVKVFERLRINIDSTIVILKDSIQQNKHREFSIKLILRANLLDFIIVTYLATFINNISSETDHENEKIYNKELEKILCEQAKYELISLQLLLGKNIISKEQYKSQLENVINVFRDYFIGDINVSNPLESLKHSNFSTVQEMFKRISNSELTFKFSNVYPLYNKFSKYEHLGLLTHHYQLETYQEIMNDILFALKFCIKGSLFCVHLINHTDENLKNMIEIEYQLNQITYN